MLPSKLLPQKNKFSRLPPQKIYFKIAFLKETNLISLTHSSLEPSDSLEEEKSLKLLLVRLNLFKILVDNNFHLS